METKYKITIEKLEPYMVTDVQYEATDGKVYRSTYQIPEGVKYKKVDYETGAKGVNKSEIFTQEVEKLNLQDVIKAINSIK